MFNKPDNVHCDLMQASNAGNWSSPVCSAYDQDENKAEKTKEKQINHQTGLKTDAGLFASSTMSSKLENKNLIFLCIEHYQDKTLHSPMRMA